MHACTVEDVRSDVEQQADRTARRPQGLAAYQSLWARYFRRHIRRQPEHAGEEQHRIVEGLPGLREVDVVDGANRRRGDR
jgi:hypothetical protein